MIISVKSSRLAFAAACLVLLGAALFAIVPGAAQASQGVVSSFGSPNPGAGPGELNAPEGLAVNEASGDVYVADSANDRIQQFTPSGAFVRSFGSAGSGAAQLSDPQGLAVNQSTGNLYVTDQGNLRVDEFSADGAFIRAFGAGVVASGPDQVPLNERQLLTVSATGGTLAFQATATGNLSAATATGLLSFATGTGDLSAATGTGNLLGPATGRGKLTSGSPVVEEVTTTTGAFAAGREITGPGIPSGTTITAIGAGTLELSANANANASAVALVVPGSKTVTGLTTSTGAFAIGQQISGPGIPSGATVTALGAGTLELSAPATANGSAVALTAGSKTVTGLTTSTGAFAIGAAISAPGIPAGATIKALGAGTLELSAPATANGSAVALTAGSKDTVEALTTSTGAFAVGQQISGPGIPSGTTITKVGASTLELSADATAFGPGVALAAGSNRVTALSAAFGAFSVGDPISGPGIPPGTTIEEVGPTTLELSAPATANGAHALAATDPATTVAYDAPATGPGSVQKALEDLLGAGNIAVSGQPGGPYAIEFRAALANTNVPQLTLTTSGLSGGTATVATTVQGASAPEVCAAADVCKAGVSTSSGGAFAAPFDGYLAVVPPGAPGAGDVLVADPGNSRIEQFTPSGAFIRAYGREVDRYAVEEREAGDPVTAAEEDLCTATSGDLCQAATPGSAPGQFAAASPTRLAIDSAGDVYTVESSANFRVQKLTPSGAGFSASVFAPSLLTGTEAADSPTDLALDPGSGDLYVLQGFPSGTGTPAATSAETRLLRLSPSGALLETGMVGDEIASADGLALDPAAGALYLSSTASGQRVYLLGEVPSPLQSCPNRSLREESNVNPATGLPYDLALPDCRAYEQVTPSYTDGFKVLNGTALSEDGSRLYGKTLGTFAGAEDNSELNGANYQFSRTPSGWQVAALNFPTSRFSVQTHEVSWNAPDGSTLWELRPASDPFTRQRDIYVRAPGGALTEVGPLLPPGAPRQGNRPNVVAMSRDFSHVVFRATTTSLDNEIWPFDSSSHTGFGSIYEYTGTGNSEPQLVGVSGPPGSDALISQCGTELAGPIGAGEAAALHAVSASGETVYFTPEHVNNCPGQQPPVTELYARLGAAKTLDISEPALSGPACTGLCAEYLDETGGHHRSPASFQGASEDGSRAFFTTAQPLLNSDRDAGTDLYMSEIEGEGASATLARLVQVSAGQATAHHPTAGAGAEVLGVPAVSSDGSRAYFVATGELTAEPNGLGKTAVPGADNLYVYDVATQRTAFVATLSPSDSLDWTTNHAVQPTPDGDYLVFESEANLTGDAPDGTTQLYRYDALTGALLRVSIGQAGFNHDGATGNMSWGSGQSISADGAYVFFSSSDGLTPAALNEVTLDNEGGKARNVYEWEADHTGACDLAAGCVSLISDGRDESTEEGGVLVGLIGTDASGTDVFFTTTDPLVPSAIDSGTAIYDARAAGGFPAPPPPPPGCEGPEACQGPYPPAPTESTPGTAAFSGPGNEPTPSPPTNSPKHHKKHTKKSHKRAASHKRGGEK